MAEPTASIWEVTRLILDSPGASPSEIAQAHGFSAAEVAELLPLFLDNVRTDYNQAVGQEPVPLAPPADGDVEALAERYLSDLVQNTRLDVVGYDNLRVHSGQELDDIPPVAEALVPGPQQTGSSSAEPTTNGFATGVQMPQTSQDADATEQVTEQHEPDPITTLDLGDDDPFVPGPEQPAEDAHPGGTTEPWDDDQGTFDA